MAHQAKSGQREREIVKQAERLARKGKVEEAITRCLEWLQSGEESARIHQLLGTLYTSSHNNSQALEHYSSAVRIEPDNSVYLALFAEALFLNGYVEEALGTYKRSLEIDGKNYVALAGLGALLCQHEQFFEALEYLQQAIVINPGDLYGLLWTAVALANCERFDEALECAEKALRHNPASADAQAMLGRIYMYLGDKDKARSHLTTAIKRDPAMGHAYALLASVMKFTEQDRWLIEEMEERLKDSLVAVVKEHIHFALGKAYDDLGQWDKAFFHYKKGNDMAVTSYDDTALKKNLKKTKGIFTRAFFERRKDMGVDSEIPVFVIGMPRSGTTLTDTILSSHSLVESVGESTLIDRISREYLAKGKLEYPESLPEVSGEQVKEAAELYLEKISSVAGQETRRVVNKMPVNFFHLGVIALMFPKARIIYLKRNPLDNCLSCYFQRFFSRRLGWSTDLEQLGAFYRRHLEFMEHWKRVLPVPILEVRYEDLVNDFDNEARRIVEFCGLEWEDGCAQFHSSSKGVRTASAMQVRRPIYTSSVGRWKNYANHLGPLIDALGKEARPFLEAVGERSPGTSRMGSILRRLVGAAR